MISKEIYSLGFGSPIGISAEHGMLVTFIALTVIGEGLLDIFDVLMPFAKVFFTSRSLWNRKKKQLKSKTLWTNCSPRQRWLMTTRNTISKKFERKKRRKFSVLILRLISLLMYLISLNIMNRITNIWNYVSLASPILANPPCSIHWLEGIDLLLEICLVWLSAPSHSVGLTRDSISTEIQYKDHIIELVDTAGIPVSSQFLWIGIKKNSYHGQKTANSLSIMNTYKSISLSHVICLLLDGEKQLTREEISFANTVFSISFNSYHRLLKREKPCLFAWISVISFKTQVLSNKLWFNTWTSTCLKYILLTPSSDSLDWKSTDTTHLCKE